MDDQAWMARISIDAVVHHGEPCIKGILAEAAARALKLERLAGCLVVITPGRVRVRRPSP